MTRPAEVPRVPRPARKPMTAKEQLYFRALQHWWEHKKCAPSMPELMGLLNKSGHRVTKTPIYAALRMLEDKGYVKRDDKGKFEVVP